MNESSIRNRLSECYLLGDERRSDTVIRIDAGQLSEPRPLQAFLDDYEGTVPHARPHEIASRLSYHLMTPVLKAGLFLLHRQRYVALDPERMVFEKYENAPAGYEWGMRLPGGFELETIPNRQRARSRWRQDLFDRLYGPWYKALCRVTRCPERVLWENLTHVTVGQLRRRYRAEFDPDRRTELVGDLVELGRWQSGGLPTLDGIDSPAEPGSFDGARGLLEQPGRYRRTTCCLNYRAGEYCGACPLPPAVGSSTAQQD